MSEKEIDIYKLLYIGDRKPQPWDTASRPIHIRISIGPDELNPGKPGPIFSGMGVIGAKRNGDCADSSCQCEDAIREYMENDQITYADGWNAEKLAEVLKCWERWHMNGTRAGCEHQQEGWDISEELEVISWKLTFDAWKQLNNLKASAIEAAKNDQKLQLTEDERSLLNAKLSVVWPSAPAPLPEIGQIYEIDKNEIKVAGWVYPSDHPKGLLTKACETCGYKYGSSWLFEAIPSTVIEYVQSLPDAIEACKWGRL